MDYFERDDEKPTVNRLNQFKIQVIKCILATKIAVSKCCTLWTHIVGLSDPHKKVKFFQNQVL